MYNLLFFSSKRSSRKDDLGYVTINTASAIVGTYRILLLRAHKRLTGPTSKEELRKFRAIAHHAYNQSLEDKSNSQTCEDCTRVSATHNKNLNSCGNSPSSSSATSSEIVGSATVHSHRKTKAPSAHANNVKSKLCVIL